MQVLKMISILVLCQLLGANETSLQITQNEKVSISSDKNSYENLEPMKLTVSCIDRGYITILYRAEDGYIGVVKDNAVCNRLYNFPDNEEDFGMVAENNLDHNITEQYIVFFSKKKMSTKIFEVLNHDRYYHKYGKNPLEVFKRTYKDSSSITITIKGK